MSNQKFQLKGGVIVIGALFWEKDLKGNDNLRLNWRENSLDLQKKVLAKLPIRYGRYSDNNIYTMVFSTNCEKNGKLGTGYIIPFKQNTITHLDSLICEARKMSEAEGMNSCFIGGTKDVWGSMVILINRNNINEALAKMILERWAREFSADGGGKDITDYRVGREKLSITKHGELQILWPRAVDADNNLKIDEIDFLLAASTKPKYQQAGQIKYPSASEIAISAKKDTKRHYFVNNFSKSITTLQDNLVINLIK